MAVTGTEAKIAEALLWYVGQIVTTPPLKVANPNVGFTPTLNTPYLAVTYMPNGAALDGLPFNSDETHIGLLQISVFWPAGAGIVQPMQVAAQVAAAFAPGLRFARGGVEVSVDQKPITSGALQESDWMQIPVTVRWIASAPPA